MSEHLGKAVLELEANLGPFEANLKVANRSADGTQKHLFALAEVSRITARALGNVKLTTKQAVESDAVSKRIEQITGGLSREARDATDHLHRVKMTALQAAETAAVGEKIDGTLDKIERKASRTRRALESVRLLGLGGMTPTTGRGVGPFGSGYGRIGAIGAAIGLGTLTAPAAGPGVLGLLAGLPTLAAGGAGAIGTLVLALQGVGKAIGGDKKAFDALQPSQQRFVLTIRSLTGYLDRLKQTAASSLFPGLTKGLTAALSPGTLGEVTKAVREFGAAIGAAGAQWGRYFGSARFQQIFGPLMQAGARGITVLSGTVLSLFDAFGTLARAAIPFTTWLEDSAAKGARWLDTFTRAKDASGGLSRALDEAQVSLRLVGRLVEALWHAVYSLGKALYPVAKVAVKNLTDGLNGLSKILDDNQGAIRTVAGALVTGLTTAIKIVVGALSLLNEGLSHVVGAKSTIITAITAIGIALTLTLGPQAAAITGVILAIGLITKHWSEFKDFFSGLMTALQGIAKVGIAGLLVIFAVLASGAAQVLGWIPGIGPKIKSAMQGVSGFVSDLMKSGAADIKAGGLQMGQAWSTAFASGASGGFLGLQNSVGNAVNSAATNVAMNPTAATPEGSPFGSLPAWTKNLGAAAKAKGLVARGIIPDSLSGSFKMPPSLILSLAGRQSGEFSMGTGDSLLSTSARLAIAKAKITPGKEDDLKALTSARAELIKFTKQARDWMKLPIAEEIGKLSTSINNLKSSFDGFNLTLAEQRRHSLDARYADRYHARAGANMSGTPGPAVYAPTIYTHDEADQKKKMRADWFAFRNTVLAG